MTKLEVRIPIETRFEQNGQAKVGSSPLFRYSSFVIRTFPFWKSSVYRL